MIDLIGIYKAIKTLGKTSERNKTEDDSKARRKPGFVFDKKIEKSSLGPDTQKGVEMVSDFRFPHGRRSSRRIADTEPELRVIPGPEGRVTADQMGISGGQGRTGEEVRGSGRVIKWLVIVLMFIFVSWLIAMPFLSNKPAS